MARNMELAWKIFGHIAMNDDWNQESWTTVEDEDELAAQPDAEDIIDIHEFGLPEWKVDGRKAVDPNICGTAFCFAGHAVNMTHARPLFLVEDDGTGEEFFDPTTGKIASISTVAANKLGLDDNDANVLFDGNNDLEDIEALLEEWEAETV